MRLRRSILVLFSKWCWAPPSSTETTMVTSCWQIIRSEIYMSLVPWQARTTSTNTGAATRPANCRRRSHFWVIFRIIAVWSRIWIPVWRQLLLGVGHRWRRTPCRGRRSRASSPTWKNSCTWTTRRPRPTARMLTCATPACLPRASRPRRS